MMAVSSVYRLHRFLNATWEQIIVFKKRIESHSHLILPFFASLFCKICYFPDMHSYNTSYLAFS